MSKANRNECTSLPPCSALVKEAERVLKYLREIGEQTRDESTFPSVDYADAMADGLEYALKEVATRNEPFVDADACQEVES